METKKVDFKYCTFYYLCLTVKEYMEGQSKYQLKSNFWLSALSVKAKSFSDSPQREHQSSQTLSIELIY